MERLDESFSSIIEYTSRNMKRYATGRLRRFGLTVDQWGVVKLLDESGGAVSFGEMSERLLRGKPTLTRIVDKLVRDGLVRREEDPEDRRRLQISLTAEGASTVQEAAVVVQQLRSEVSRGVTRKDMQDLRRILGALNRNIEHARGAEP